LVDIRCNDKDYDDKAESLKEMLAGITEKMMEQQSKALINKGWLVTKNYGLDVFMTFHNGWDTIPLINVEWKIIPKGHDHHGMYFLLASFGFLFEFNIYNIHHVE